MKRVLFLLIFVYTLLFTACGEKSDQVFESEQIKISEMNENLAVGDCFYFGSYKEEALLWKVLEKEDNDVLIMSFYGIDSMAYHSSYETINYAKSEIRAFLNDSFYGQAFSDEEKERILKTSICNEANPSYGTDGGEDTEDFIYLLSIDESEKLLTEEAGRIRPGSLAMEHGAAADRDGFGFWWLRSPGFDGNYAAYMTSEGKCFSGGRRVDEAGGMLCPVMQISLK